MHRTRREFLGRLAWVAALELVTESTSCATPTASDFFLEGNFAPVHEEITAAELPVRGRLPAELEGLYARNGPNPQFPPLGRYHWFDGDGMVHGVYLEGGRASYRNRYVRTRGWQQERAAGRALFRGLLEPPDPRQLLAPDGVPFKNAANTALVLHQGRLLALWEAGPPHELRARDLETLGEHTFAGRLRHPFTAHPKIDPRTGEMFCFGTSFLQPPYLQYSTIDPRGHLTQTIPVPLPEPVMMHDFAITARHAIFLDLPEVFDLQRAVRGQHPLYFRKDRASRIGVMPRDGSGPVQWFASPACYVFHTLNAWDDGEWTELLACRMPHFPDLIAFDGQPADPHATTDGPQLYRWRLHRPSGRVVEGPVDERPVEFPQIPASLLGQPTRYGYAALVAPGARFSGLVRYDLATGRQSVHQYGPGQFGGEAVFVPKAGGSGEAAGWLLTLVRDERENVSELVVIDAEDLPAPPVARVRLPARVPYGFHGLWIPRSQMA